MITAAVNLGTLVRVFFGQDSDLFGESVDEILESYRNTENAATVQKTVVEAEILLDLHPDDRQLKTAFAKVAEGEFSPKAWGFTARTFLEKVIVTLRQA